MIHWVIEMFNRCKFTECFFIALKNDKIRYKYEIAVKCDQIIEQVQYKDMNKNTFSIVSNAFYMS